MAIHMIKGRRMRSRACDARAVNLGTSLGPSVGRHQGRIWPIAVNGCTRQSCGSDWGFLSGAPQVRPGASPEPAQVTFRGSAGRPNGIGEQRQPLSSSASVMVSGGSSLTPRPRGRRSPPAGPARTRRRTPCAASSPCSNARPCAIPRPRAGSRRLARTRATRLAPSAIRPPLASARAPARRPASRRASAAVPVTSAGLKPRKVPLCSPGSQTSRSGAIRVSASGSP